MTFTFILAFSAQGAQEVAMIMIAATMVMMTMNMNGWELNSGDLRRKVREEQMMETQGQSKSI